MSASRYVIPDPDAPTLAAIPTGAQSAAPVSWESYMLPTYRQRGNVCVSTAACNVFEGLIVAELRNRGLVWPTGYQLDEYRVDQAVRNRFWARGYTGGVYLTQAWRVMRDDGCLPADARWEYVARDWGAVCAALSRSPLLTGNRIHAGWSQLSRFGVIDHRPAPDKRLMAHAMAVTGAMRAGSHRVLSILQSWGQAGAGGLVFLTWGEYTEGLLRGAPMELVLPSGPGDGWRDWLVRRGAP